MMVVVEAEEVVIRREKTYHGDTEYTEFILVGEKLRVSVVDSACQPIDRFEFSRQFFIAVVDYRRVVLRKKV